MNSPRNALLILILAFAGSWSVTGCPRAVTVPKTPPPAEKITDDNVTKAVAKGEGWLLNQQQAVVTDDDVRTAIEKAGAYLQKQQQKNGLWPEQANALSPTAAGTSELALYTQLMTGTSPVNDFGAVMALDAMMARKLEQTSTVSLRLLACSKAVDLLRAPTPRRNQLRALAIADVQWLVVAQDAGGGWQRGSPARPGAKSDLASTYVALLSLNAATQVGVQLPPAVFERARRYLYGLQQPDGSWPIADTTWPDSPESFIAATAAAVDCLYIIGDQLELWGGCPCRANRMISGQRAELQRRIELALKWLEPRYSLNLDSDAALLWLHRHPDRDAGLHPEERLQPIPGFYWLYAAQRAAMQVGYKYLGPSEVYRSGVVHLLAHQQAEGSWGDIPNTCFAMLFLQEGRAPVAVNKLSSTPGGALWEWNNHPRDVAHLLEYLRKQSTGAFQWQIVNLKMPLEVLHEAPILYLSPETPPKFTAEEKAKLRAFTDTGGTILVEPSCGAPAVKEWFVQFAREIWPEWPLKPLEPEHGIFLLPNRLKQRPEVMGIHDGKRTIVFYSLDDISCPWQTLAVMAKQYLFLWGQNLINYAINRQPLPPRLGRKAPAPEPNNLPPMPAK
jgi:hypothetical protein